MLLNVFYLQSIIFQIAKIYTLYVIYIWLNSSLVNLCGNTIELTHNIPCHCYSKKTIAVSP